MTWIGLEGVDGAGKSTIAAAVISELEKRYPGEEILSTHRSQLTRDPLDEYALDVESYRPGNGTHIVADRWHWGETIYGPLYRKKSALDTAGFRWVELYLKTRGATVWHVTARLETIRERLVTRGEDYLQSHHVERVWEGFRDCAKQSMICGGTAETDKYAVKELARRIVNDAVYQEEQAAGCFRPEYLGRSLPHTLLVGDKQGTGAPGVTLAPFMPRGTSSGKFLLEALPEKWWAGVGIVNAHETKLLSLVESLYDPNVIALGANASEALEDAGVDHAIVPHPQKIRRFHNKHQTAYGVLIREVSTQGGNKLTWPK